MATPAVTYRIGAVDETRGAIQSALAGFQRLEGAVQGVRSQFGLVGATLGAGALLAFVNQGIQAADQLDELAQKTSLSVETLDSLAQVARISGQDLNGVANVAGRFARSIGEAAAGNKELLAALRDVGISADDLRSKNFDQLFVQFGQAIAQAGNQQTAFAVAAKLAGRNVQELLPFFNDLASEGLKAARITTEQARAAAEYNDNMGRLRRELDEVAITLGNNLVPRLNAVAEAMRRAREESGGFFTQLYRGSQALLTGNDLDKARKDFRRLSDELVAINKLIDENSALTGGASTGRGALLEREKQRITAELNSANALILLERNAMGNAPQQAAGRQIGDSSLRAEETNARRAGAAVRDSIREVEDYAARLKQVVADSIGGSALVKTRELQDAIGELDKLFFDGKIPLDIYTSALARLTGAMSGVKAPADELAGLLARTPGAQQAEAGRLTGVVDEAFFSGRITEQQQRELLALVNGYQQLGREIETADEFGRSLGLTLSSAAGEALRNWEGFGSFMRALGQDIGQIIYQLTVLKPLQSGIAGLVKDADLGSLFRGVGGGGGGGAGGSWRGGGDFDLPSFDVGTAYVPRDMIAKVHQGERIIPAAQNRAGAMGGAVSITNVYNIDSRSDQAAIIAEIRASEQRTLAQVVEARSRGGAFARAF
jgi:hypothetical protein